MDRTKRLSLLLVAFLLLPTACSSSVSSGELSEAENKLSELVAELETRQESVTELEGQLASLNQEVKDLNSQIEAGQTESSELEGEIQAVAEAESAADAERGRLTDQRTEIRQDFEAVRAASDAYANFLRSQRDLLNDESCADSITSFFSRIGVTEVDELNDLYDKADISTDQFVRDRDLFEISPIIGCPGYWFDEVPPTFSTNSRIMDAVCESDVIDLLARDPSRFENSCITGWAYIVQFDTNTGPCTFHANIGNSNVASYNYEHRASFTDPNDCEWMDRIGQGDELQFWASAKGTVTYTTVDGNQNTIPAFRIFRYRG